MYEALSYFLYTFFSELEEGAATALLMLFSALMLLYCCFTSALVHTDVQEVELEEGAHERP